MVSSEGHTHFTRKNFTGVVNPFDNIEVLLNVTIATINPFTNNDINKIIIPPTSDSPDPSPTPPDPSPTPSKDPSIQIRVNANNSIIHTNRDISIIITSRLQSALSIDGIPF